MKPESVAPVLTYHSISRSVIKQGFRWFEKPFDLNVIAIRVNIRETAAEPDLFDDLLTVNWSDEWGMPCNLVFRCSTDPGEAYLKRPLNSRGTAILKPGQYRGSHELGLHKGKPALVQRRRLLVFRDNDRDSVHDLDPDRVRDDVAGLNIHRAAASGNSTHVGRWSAGCIVTPDPDDLEILLSLVRRQERQGLGDRVSLTLLEVNDLEIDSFLRVNP